MQENYEARTARSYALVGFIFYILGAVSSFLGSAFFMGGFMGPGMMGGFAPSFFPFFPSIFLIISLVLAVWSWVTLNNINAGRYQDAQTASLVLGILGIFFAWLIGGIFFLLAYGRLGYAIRHPHATLKPSVPTVPTVAPPATGTRFCPECGSAVSESDRFCRNCGKTL